MKKDNIQTKKRSQKIKLEGIKKKRIKKSKKERKRKYDRKEKQKS